MKSIDLLSIIIISCVGITVYSNAYHASFHFDDFYSIVNDPYIRNIHHLDHIWYIWPSRFFTYLSFALNYHLNGLNVFGYHLFNLTVHLISAVLVWWLVRLTLATPVMKGQTIAKDKSLIALLVGLVFVAHPLQTEAVTYIVQRAASMASMFYLASLGLYVQSRLLEEKSSAKYYYMASLITAVLAMFCKEMAITLPLMILFYEYSFLKTNRKINWKYLIPFLLTLLIIPLTTLLTHSVNFQELHRITEKPPGISFMHYFVVQWRVLVTYIRLIFFPFNQNLDYDYPISKSVLELPTLMSFLFLGAILLWAKRLYPKYRLISFSIFWFFLTLLPESSFWPIHDVFFEHRLYLPVAGYSVFLVGGLYYILGKNHFTAMVMLLVVIIVGYGFLTYQRNKIWGDEFILWNETIQKSPHKARPYINRGLAYYRQAHFARAVEDDSIAINLNPDDDNEYYNRGVAYVKQADFTKALADYTQAIKLNPENADAYYNRGNIFYKQGNLIKAISDYNKAISVNFSNEDAYNNRGLCYYKEENFKQALSDYNKAVKLNSKDADAYYNLACLYDQLKDYDKSWTNVHKAEQSGHRVDAKFLNKLKTDSGSAQ